MTLRADGRARKAPRGTLGGNRARFLPVCLIIAGALFFAEALFGQTTPAAKGSETPTPTPKAAPKLSGGFGRPRATSALEPWGPPPADAVRAADATRGKPSEKSTVSITNKTLITDPEKGRISTLEASPGRRTPAAEPTPPRTALAEGSEPTESASGGPAPPKAEAQWRASARNARTRVEDLKKHIEDFQREEAKLQTDFYAWDDGQYRDGVIKPAWDKKREELEAARKELAVAEKELAELPEKARKAGALPGWLRE